MKEKSGVNVLCLIMVMVLLSVLLVNPVSATTAKEVVGTGQNYAVVAYVTTTYNTYKLYSQSFGSYHEKGDPDEPMVVTVNATVGSGTTETFGGSFGKTLLRLEARLGIHSSIQLSVSQTVTKTIASSKPTGWYRVELRSDWCKVDGKVQKEGMQGTTVEYYSSHHGPLWPGFVLVRYAP